MPKSEQPLILAPPFTKGGVFFSTKKSPQPHFLVKPATPSWRSGISSFGVPQRAEPRTVRLRQTGARVNYLVK
ncbi:MAG: hypothetical protein A2729_05755 [Candidatus Buchananbacteria bacterium RIFCSPHIGHO2_01_FULL_39_14]|uniref:Uncharacterized protein n=1 Tax=Candidatus Buchananbacteria bacterium RIFCSPHIGHO2_01_FULL_39_14 TaxID=1797532 RepID=A0A1G1XSP0_9BACT|nr:MAG: hypothetical protein A2729_05755 [Candidatus Buchananbacteria bacterium RIFCSPHIGHO2_01_FULL_39_14]